MTKAGNADARGDRARLLAEKICEPTKLVVKEELAVVAMQLNLQFLELESVSEVAALADAVYSQNAGVVSVLHCAVQEGDACAHVLLELLYQLTYSAGACAAIVREGVIETVIGVLPALGDVAQCAALQLLDRLTTDDRADKDDTSSSRRLCRVACAHILWTVLADDSSSWSLTPAISLLDKISRAVVSPTGQQVVQHTLRRSPPVEALLSWLLARRGAWGLSPPADESVAHQLAMVLARVHRWRLLQDSEKPKSTADSNL